jgi:hypothetical protein
MPWHIEHAPGTAKGYFVVTTATGKKHSNHPLSLQTAKKQLIALEIHSNHTRDGYR